MPPGESMLLAAKLLKLVAEIALMAMLGRWLLGALAGPSRESNLFWRLLDSAVAPLERLLARARLRRPAPVLLALMLLLWLGATAWKIHLCLRLGVQACT